MPGSGDLDLAVAVPLETALRNGDAVRPTWEGVAVLDGGALGRLMAGLSHEEKKSSSPA